MLTDVPIYLHGELQVVASILHTLMLGVAVLGTPALAIHCHLLYEERERQAKSVHPDVTLSPGLVLGPPRVCQLQTESLRDVDKLRRWREWAACAVNVGTATKLASKVFLQGLQFCRPHLKGCLAITALRFFTYQWRMQLPAHRYWGSNAMLLGLLWTCSELLWGGSVDMCLAQTFCSKNLAEIMLKSTALCLGFHCCHPVGVRYLYRMLMMGLGVFLARTYLTLSSSIYHDEVSWFWNSSSEEQLRYVWVLFILPVYVPSMLLYVHRYREESKHMALFLARNGDLIRSSI